MLIFCYFVAKELHVPFVYKSAKVNEVFFFKIRFNHSVCVTFHRKNNKSFHLSEVRARDDNEDRAQHRNMCVLMAKRLREMISMKN